MNYSLTAEHEVARGIHATTWGPAMPSRYMARHLNFVSPPSFLRDSLDRPVPCPFPFMQQERISFQVQLACRPPDLSQTLSPFPIGVSERVTSMSPSPLLIEF